MIPGKKGGVLIVGFACFCEEDDASTSSSCQHCAQGRNSTTPCIFSKVVHAGRMGSSAEQIGIISICLWETDSCIIIDIIILATLQRNMLIKTIPEYPHSMLVSYLSVLRSEENYHPIHFLPQTHRFVLLLHRIFQGDRPCYWWGR